MKGESLPNHTESTQEAESNEMQVVEEKGDLAFMIYRS